MSPKYLCPTYDEVVKKYKKYKFSGLVVHIGGIISPDFFSVKNFVIEKKFS